MACRNKGSDPTGRHPILLTVIAESVSPRRGSSSASSETATALGIDRRVVQLEVVIEG